MEQEVRIAPPDGYVIDKENSTFECIKFKKKEKSTFTSYLTVDEDGTETIFDKEPLRDLVEKTWVTQHFIADCWVILPKGTIEKIIGRKLTWKDEPVKLQ